MLNHIPDVQAFSQLRTVNEKTFHDTLIFPLILIEDMAIIILEVISMKEKECKQECNQKQNKNVEFAKEIFNIENKKNEKQNKEKQC